MQFPGLSRYLTAGCNLMRFPYGREAGVVTASVFIVLGWPAAPQGTISKDAGPGLLVD